MLTLLIGWIKGLFSGWDPDDDPTPPKRGVMLRAANKSRKKKTKKT